MIVAAAIVRFNKIRLEYVAPAITFRTTVGRYVEVAIDCYLFTQTEFGKLKSVYIRGI